MSQFGRIEENELRLDIEKTVDETVFSDFYCGVDVMDIFLHTRYKEYISMEGLDTFVVRYRETVVAMFALRPDTLILDDDDKDEMRAGWVPKPDLALKDCEFLDQSSFDAVEIAYLAVERSMRKQGIGRFIIEEIVGKVLEENPRCQFITVDALATQEYSAVDFYHKCDFESAELPTGKETIRMYRVLIPTKTSSSI